MAETILMPYDASLLDDVAALEKLCFSTPWSKESFREVGESTDHIFWILAETKAEACEVLGFGCVSVMLDEGELLNIAVSPTHRRKGIGQILLSALLCEANWRGVRRMFLEVRESNLPAQSLYLRNGFTPVGRRKRYYHDPTEDAILMMREQTDSV